MGNKFKFIHIGQGKCLSTYLQNLWAQDHYCNFYHGMNLGDDLTRAFLNNQSVSVDFSEVNDEGKPNILSYECFTYFGVTESSELLYEDKFFERIRFIAKKLSGSADTALLIVRDPLDWIRSSHAQYIKYGGFESAQKYYEKFREGIISNLNLSKITAIWKQEGFRDVILPMEMFKEDVLSFWRQYEEKLGLDKPKINIFSDLKNNVTPKRDLELKALVNRVVFNLNNNMNFREGNAKESEILDWYLKWGVRRYFENSTAKDKDDLKALLSFEKRGDFFDVELSKEDSGKINLAYSKALEGLDWFSDYRKRYIIDGF